MNKLLKFFIPKALIAISTYIGLGLILSIIIKLLPITDYAKTFFIFLVFYLFFPIFSYFHTSIYLPSSLEWILLTPTKKFHIFLANGFINIFKIVLILVLLIIASIGFRYYHWDLYPTTIPDISLYPNFDTISVTSLMLLIAVLSMILIFISGILPNYGLQNIQQRKSYQNKLPMKDKLKSFGLVYGVLILFSYYLFEDSDTNNYLPWLIKGALLLNLLWVGAIYSTLKSLRYYFSGVKLIISSFMSSILLILFLHSYASRDINSEKIPISDKIESLNFLGAYSSNLEGIINSELLLSLPNTTYLRYNDLKPFLERTNRKKLNHELLKTWMQKCNQRKDFHCRLAFYVQRYYTNDKASADFLTRSCPKDLGSCYLMYNIKNISPQGREYASTELNRRCVKNSDEFESNICDVFKRSQKK